MPHRVIATTLALIGFTTAIVAGLIAQNPAVTTLWRALVAMVACYAVGLGVGAAAQRAVQEHVEQYQRQHPLEPGAEHEQQAAPPSQEAEGGAPPSEVEPATQRDRPAA